MEQFSEIPSPVPAGADWYHTDQKETAGTVSEQAAEADWKYQKRCYVWGMEW